MTARSPLAILALVTCVAASAGVALGSNLHSQSALVAKFKPGLIELPAELGHAAIPLSAVPIEDGPLRQSLMTAGVLDFVTVAPEWRTLPEPSAELDGYIPMQPVSFRDYYVLRTTGPEALSAVAQALVEGDWVQSIDRIWSAYLEYLPVDTLLFVGTGRPYQWNLRNVGGTIGGVACTTGVDVGIGNAWAVQESTTVKVGVLDSGIDSDHDDLEDNIDSSLGRSFINIGSPPSFNFIDDSGHGTEVSGIIAGGHSGDSLGIAGIAGLPGSGLTDGVIVPLKVLDTSGSTTNRTMTIAYVNALAYAEGLWPDIPVLNSSLSFWTSSLADTTTWLSEYRADLIRDAVKNTYLSGVFHAVAAGNGKPLDARKAYPQSLLDMVVGTAAVGCDESRPSHFQSGGHVDIAAPGSADVAGSPVSQIVTTTLEDGYRGIDGELLFGATSAASPHVAGAAALLLSKVPSLTNEDLREILQRTAREEEGGTGYDHDYGHGLLRIDDALQWVDTLAVVHAETASIDTSWVADPMGQYDFKNIHYTNGLAVGFIGNNWTTLYAEVYAFETTVDLDENINPGLVPDIWVRGRGSISVNPKTAYDGNLNAYGGQVVSVTDDAATLRGHTYKIYADLAAPFDSLMGWFPLKLPKSGTADVFAFTYLADTTYGSRPSRSFGPTTKAYFVGSNSVPRIDAGSNVSTIRFYDAAGRLVDTHRRVMDDQDGFSWNAVTSRGVRLPSGIYYGMPITTDGATAAGFRVVVVR